jgi:hypothetical protein
MAGAASCAGMKPPSNRYRIEERGRRLVTIDTWAETPPVQPPPSMPAAQSPRAQAAPPSVGRTKFGHIRFTSSPWYDNRAPRIIDISLGRVLLRLLFDRLFLIAFVAILVLALLLSNILIPALVIAMVVPQSRAWVGETFRRFMTARIDAMDDLDA